MFRLSLKLIIFILIIVGLILIGISTGVINISLINKSSEVNQKIVLERVEEIGNLELVRFNLNDIVEQSVVRKLLDIDNLAPDSKVLVIINGEAAACVDLKKVTKEDIKEDEENLYIKLPQPKICYAKVNHNQSKIYDMNLTARLLNPELIDEAFKNGENSIKEEALKMGILEQAKENAKKVLAPLFKDLSKKNIVISFSD